MLNNDCPRCAGYVVLSRSDGEVRCVTCGWSGETRVGTPLDDEKHAVKSEVRPEEYAFNERTVFDWTDTSIDYDKRTPETKRETGNAAPLYYSVPMPVKMAIDWTTDKRPERRHQSHYVTITRIHWPYMGFLPPLVRPNTPNVDASRLGKRLSWAFHDVLPDSAKVKFFTETLVYEWERVPMRMKTPPTNDQYGDIVDGYNATLPLRRLETSMGPLYWKLGVMRRKRRVPIFWRVDRWADLDALSTWGRTRWWREVEAALAADGYQVVNHQRGRSEMWRTLLERSRRHDIETARGRPLSSVA